MHLFYRMVPRIWRGWPPAGAAVMALALMPGCGSSADSSALSSGGGSGGSSGNSGIPTALAFEPSSTLELAPGEQRTLQVVAKPRAAYHVRFALVGDPGNAALDRSEVETDESGVAKVGLTAPTLPTTFSVRASVGTSMSAEAAVSVSAGGYATLVVHPDYGGKRLEWGDRWVASVRAGTDCASLTGTPPPDGDLKGTSQVALNLSFKDPQIDSVPVGPALAVTARAGHFAGGCIDVQDLVPGTANMVTVPVVDRAMQLDQTDLDVELGIDTSAAEWGQMVSNTIGQTTDAMVDGAADDVVALLDAMQTALGQSAAASDFSQARATDGWDSLLYTVLGNGASHAIRAPVKKWLLAGATTIGGSGTFVGHLDGQGQDPGKAELTLSSIAGLAPASVGSPTDLGAVSWSADPGDTVLLGAQLSWMPSLLVTALALPPAQKDAPAATTVPEAIANQVDCSAIGTALASTGAKQNEAYPGCDATCAAALCGNGLVVMWDRARKSSASQVEAATLDISATGSVDSVDDVARPTHFDGSWVGKLSVGQVALSVGGPATGHLPPPP